MADLTKYNPLIAWKTIAKNVFQLTRATSDNPATYRITVKVKDTNDKGQGQLEDGMCFTDYLGKPYKILSFAEIFPDPPPLGLKLTWSNLGGITDAVGDINSISDWNTFFNLPTNGTPFTSVSVTGNEVKLMGGNSIILKDSIFSSNYMFSGDLNKFEDNMGCIVSTGDYCFRGCTFLLILTIPACGNLGSSTDYNSIFSTYLPLDITLTIPAALMTCNSGVPDGDIQYLIDNNTVTIITV